MITLSQTRVAARHLARHAPAALTRSRAMLLEHKLIACDSALAAGQEPSPGLVHQAVLAVRDLADPAWLHAHAGDPGVAAFTGLTAAASPPHPRILDEILSGCLRARFGTHLPAR